MEKKKQKTKIGKKVGILVLSALLVVLSLVVPCSAYTVGSTDSYKLPTFQYDGIEFTTQQNPDTAKEYRAYSFPNKLNNSGIVEYNEIPEPGSLINGYSINDTYAWYGSIVYSGNTFNINEFREIVIDFEAFTYAVELFLSIGNEDFAVKSLKWIIYPEHRYDSPYELTNYNKGVYVLYAYDYEDNEHFIMNTIHENQVADIDFTFYNSYSSGSVTLKQSLYELYEAQYITLEQYNCLVTLLVYSSIPRVMVGSGDLVSIDTWRNIQYFSSTTTIEHDYYRQDVEFTLTKQGFSENWQDGGFYDYTIDLPIETQIIRYEDLPSYLPTIRINSENSAPVDSVKIFTTLVCTTFKQEPLVDENGDPWNKISYDFIPITYEATGLAGETIYLVPDLTAYDNLSAYFNPSIPYLQLEGTVNVSIDCSTQNFSNELISEPKINISMRQYYTHDVDLFTSWYNQVIGNYYQYIPNTRPIEIPSTLVDWLSTTVGGFLNAEIVGGVSFGQIIWFVIGVGGFFAILKLFSGG